MRYSSQLSIPARNVLSRILFNMWHHRTFSFASGCIFFRALVFVPCTIFIVKCSFYPCFLSFVRAGSMCLYRIHWPLFLHTTYLGFCLSSTREWKSNVLTLSTSVLITREHSLLPIRYLCWAIFRGNTWLIEIKLIISPKRFRVLSLPRPLAFLPDTVSFFPTFLGLSMSPYV
jgi:hypothetical protein